MLPVAMVTGAVFHEWMGHLTFLSPYLIFLMLTITYCRINPAHIKPGRFDRDMLIWQMLLAAGCYGAVVRFNNDLACGIFICVFCPTAT